jgi:hypothetical protein
MFPDLSALCERSLPGNSEDMPPIGAFQFGATDIDRVARRNPDHADWIYHSPRRPLQGRLGIEADYSVLGGTPRTATIGTSEPLSREVLDGIELVPYNRTVRAASVAKTLLVEWESVPNLASVVEDGRDAQKVRVLTEVPEHEGFRSVMRFLPSACPAGHVTLQRTDPYSTRPNSLLSGVQTLLRGGVRMVSPSIADTIIRRWMDEGATVPT